MTGRPTKYKKKYCQMLVDHMRGGLSFESFAGVVRVNRDTLYEWKKVNKEFDRAHKNGSALSQLWWEQIGKAGATGQLTRTIEETDSKGVVRQTRVPTNFNAASWIFNMKNRFAWKDKHEISGPDGAPITSQVIITMPDNGRKTN